MTNNKSCKGTLYLISGKSHCIGERNANATRKTRTSKKIKTTRKTRRKQKSPHQGGF